MSPRVQVWSKKRGKKVTLAKENCLKVERNKYIITPLSLPLILRK